MVALSLQASKIPQKGDTKTEKTHEPARDSNHIRNNFYGYLRDIMLRTQRWLGVIQ